MTHLQLISEKLSANNIPNNIWENVRVYFHFNGEKVYITSREEKGAEYDNEQDYITREEFDICFRTEICMTRAMHKQEKTRIVNEIAAILEK